MIFKDEAIFDSNLKRNRGRNCAEQPSLHTIWLIFSSTCWRVPNRGIKSGEIKYLPSLRFFFLIFDQSMIFIPVYRISLLIVTKLEFLQHMSWQLRWLTIEKLICNQTLVFCFYWNRKIEYPWNVLQLSNCEIKYTQNAFCSKREIE